MDDYKKFLNMHDKIDRIFVHILGIELVGVMCIAAYAWSVWM